MTSVCIVSAAWRRADVTRLVLEQRKRVCVELAARGVDATSLIVADDENLDIAREFGCETVEAPNEPLGRKCNSGLLAAVELGADWIVWIGSDDWIHPAVFEPIIGYSGPPAIFSGRRLAIVDMARARLQRLESPSPYGAIPWLIDTRLFARADRFPPIEPSLKRGLDGGLIRGLRQGRISYGWQFNDPNDFRCVDFKTRSNITPYEGLAKHLGVGDPEPAWGTLREWFPADLVEKARLLASTLRLA